MDRVMLYKYVFRDKNKPQIVDGWGAGGYVLRFNSSQSMRKEKGKKRDMDIIGK